MRNFLRVFLFVLELSLYFTDKLTREAARPNIYKYAQLPPPSSSSSSSLLSSSSSSSSSPPSPFTFSSLVGH